LTNNHLKYNNPKQESFDKDDNDKLDAFGFQSLDDYVRILKDAHATLNEKSKAAVGALKTKFEEYARDD